MATATEFRVMLLDRPGFAHDAIAGVLDDVDGVMLLRPGDDAENSAGPDVIVVDERLLQSGSVLAVMTGAQLIVVGVDDHPGFAARAERLGAHWLAKEQAASLLPLLIGRLRT